MCVCICVCGGGGGGKVLRLGFKWRHPTGKLGFRALGGWVCSNPVTVLLFI